MGEGSLEGAGATTVSPRAVGDASLEGAGATTVSPRTVASSVGGGVPTMVSRFGATTVGGGGTEPTSVLPRGGSDTGVARKRVGGCPITVLPRAVGDAGSGSDVGISTASSSEASTYSTVSLRRVDGSGFGGAGFGASLPTSTTASTVAGTAAAAAVGAGAMTVSPVRAGAMTVSPVRAGGSGGTGARGRTTVSRSSSPQLAVIVASMSPDATSPAASCTLGSSSLASGSSGSIATGTPGSSGSLGDAASTSPVDPRPRRPRAGAIGFTRTFGACVLRRRRPAGSGSGSAVTAGSCPVTARYFAVTPTFAGRALPITVCGPVRGCKAASTVGWAPVRSSTSTARYARVGTRSLPFGPMCSRHCRRSLMPPPLPAGRSSASAKRRICPTIASGNARSSTATKRCWFGPPWVASACRSGFSTCSLSVPCTHTT